MEIFRRLFGSKTVQASESASPAVESSVLKEVFQAIDAQNLDAFSRSLKGVRFSELSKQEIQTVFERINSKDAGFAREAVSATLAHDFKDKAVAKQGVKHAILSIIEREDLKGLIKWFGTVRQDELDISIDEIFTHLNRQDMLFSYNASKAILTWAVK